jgi:hypothetical protein
MKSGKCAPDRGVVLALYSAVYIDRQGTMARLTGAE